MRINLKSIALTILVSCVLFGLQAQINLSSNDITFRSYSNANHGTTHYGDLNLEGGSSGSSWGWLSAEVVRCYAWG